MAKDNHHYVPQGYLRGFTIEGEVTDLGIR